MIDHKYGAWFRILDSNNNKYDNLKSPAGKTRLSYNGSLL